MNKIKSNLSKSLFSSIEEVTLNVDPTIDLFRNNKHSLISQKQLKDIIKEIPTIKPPKRAINKESVSDSINTFLRAAVDRVQPDNYSMRDAIKLGLMMFDNCCYICMKPVYDENFEKIGVTTIQGDHITPPIHGGTGAAGNLLLTHANCNTQKGDRTIEEYFKDDPAHLARIQNFQSLFGYEAIPPNIADELRNNIAQRMKLVLEDEVNKARKKLGYDEIYELKSRIFE